MFTIIIITVIHTALLMNRLIGLQAVVGKVVLIGVAVNHGKNKNL